MKLSELSYREYIALEVLPSFAATMLDKEAVWRSFGIADAFLKQAGKQNDRIAHAEERAAVAELRLKILTDLYVQITGLAPDLQKAFSDKGEYACATCGKDVLHSRPQDMYSWDSPTDKRMFCSLECFTQSKALPDTKIYAPGKSGD